MSRRYAVVTPVKNEEKHLEGMIHSVVSQTVPPHRWVIVDDGSTDRTGEIIRQAISSHSFIACIDLPGNASPRKPGGESIISYGIRALDLAEYGFLARLDGDISLPLDYFEKIFREFDRNPRLGIAGGICYVPRKGVLEEEKHPRFHVRGALKTYRMECFRDIGGLETQLGWDTVDVVRANMLGWETRSFSDIKVIHHRPTHAFAGTIQGHAISGIAAYNAGYHPLFLLLRAMRNMIHRPYGIGGLAMLGGFLSGYLRCLPRIGDPSLIRYLRGQQINRLLGKTTIWT